jgi:hypothetical protein
MKVRKNGDTPKKYQSADVPKKQISITLPGNILSKVGTLSDVTMNGNKSALISKIIEDFFSKENYIDECAKLGQSDFLINSKVYRDTENMTMQMFRNKVERGEITVITLGTTEFVQISEASVKNVYFRLAANERALKGLTKNVLRIQEEIGLTISPEDM